MYVSEREGERRDIQGDCLRLCMGVYARLFMRHSVCCIHNMPGVCVYDIQIISSFRFENNMNAASQLWV